MSSPLVTILTPVYNRERFLPRLFESVDAQHLQDFEHVLVDDISTDSSLAGLKAREEAHQRTRVFSNGYRKGVSGARNFGLDKAEGKYIALLDSDDYWLPDHLAVATEFLEQHPEIDFYFTNRMTVDSDDKQIDMFFETIRMVHELPAEDIGGKFKIVQVSPMKVFLRGNPVSTSSVIFRRDKLGEIRFDTELTLMEDRDFWIRYTMESGGKIAFRLEPAVKYMRHEEGTMGQSSAFYVRQLSTQLRVLAQCHRDYRFDAEEEAIWKAQRKKLLAAYAYHLRQEGNWFGWFANTVKSKF